MANPRICSVPGCDKTDRRLCRGLCGSHYRRLLRHGDPLGGGTFRAEKQDSCTVNGCGSEVFASGLCSKHYARARTHGTPLAGGTPKGEARQWLHDHAEHSSNECLLFPYTCPSSDGYGKVGVDGRQARANRYMCEIAHGPAPTPRHQAAHSCGNGHLGCVNPGHLRWATHIENMADKVEHGTLLMGEAAPWSKLKADDILFIRANRGVIYQKDLASLFGISKSAVGAIQLRKRWKHVP